MQNYLYFFIHNLVQFYQLDIQESVVTGGLHYHNFLDSSSYFRLLSAWMRNAADKRD